MSINIPTAYKVKITPDYGDLAKIVEWCQRNCAEDWRFMEDTDDQWNSYKFFFESEKDYVAFLVWQK